MLGTVSKAGHGEYNIPNPWLNETYHFSGEWGIEQVITIGYNEFFFLKSKETTDKTAHRAELLTRNYTSKEMHCRRSR